MSRLVPHLQPATHALLAFVEAGVLDAAAVQVAGTIARVVGGVSFEVLLGAALATRAPVNGHVCVVPNEVAASIVLDGEPASAAPLPWPSPGAWAAALQASAAVRRADDPVEGPLVPLVWDGTRLYLERYWRYEELVVTVLLARAADPTATRAQADELEAVLDRHFGPADPLAPDQQRRAVTTALTRHLAVIAGGPGTGKTRTIARILAAAHEMALVGGTELQVALAAPTGKAAARMTEAVRSEIALVPLSEDVAAALMRNEATTLHRLLGLAWQRTPRYDRANPLPYDLVIVDETSMVSLPLMAHLLNAIRPEATVVLVGDPFQLESVEAGAVLGEIVGPLTAAPTPRGREPLARDIVLLDRVHRFAPDSPIAALADRIRAGDADGALELLRVPSLELHWVDADDAAAIERLQRDAAGVAMEVVRAAARGDAAEGLRLASELKVLCATRLGPLGSHRWSDRIETEIYRRDIGATTARRWYVGRPVIMTNNDYLNGLFNGDVGLVVAGSDNPLVAFPDSAGIRTLSPSRLGDVETWWAMTIHKSQGSEFERVVVSLPPPPSPILSRELLYTAITRGRKQVAVVASEASLRTAISHPVARASGIGARLRG